MSDVILIIKAKFFKLAYFVWLFLSPIHFILGLVGLAVMIDTWYGRKTAKLKAIREGKDPRIEVKSKITRERFSAKLFVYNTVIISCFVLDTQIFNDLVNYFMSSFPIKYAVTKSIGIIFMLIEADSIDENYYKNKGIRLRTVFSNKIGKIKTALTSLCRLKKEIDEIRK